MRCGGLPLHRARRALTPETSLIRCRVRERTRNRHSALPLIQALARAAPLPLSVDLDAAALQQLLQYADLALHHRREFLGRAADDLRAYIEEALLALAGPEHAGDLLVQPGHDGRR